uniref:DJ-1/PfpI domain-containing protein n=1 Tax=Aegilops tauschii subsp. strangulata TaxID=200361 RepID=A0A453EE12_AEGTS
VAGTEPIEASIPIDILRRAGANVTVASAGDALLVEIMYGVKILADELLVDCAAASYDLIVLPGGVPGAANLGGRATLEGIVRKHVEKGGLFAAICAAPPLALASWGLLDGHKVTTCTAGHCKSGSSNVRRRVRTRSWALIGHPLNVASHIHIS